MRQLSNSEMQKIFGGVEAQPTERMQNRGSSEGEYVGAFFNAICSRYAGGLIGMATCSVGSVAVGDAIDAYLALPDSERPVLPNLGFH